MAIITKKEEKLGSVVNALNDKYSPDDFVTMFQEMYPKDWGKDHARVRETRTKNQTR